VTLRVVRTELPPAGGEFPLPADLNPSGCLAPIATNVPWLKMTDVAGLRFTAENNPSPAVRDAVVTIADTSFFVRQTPAPQPGLAAVPSRLVFGIRKKGHGDIQRLTAWSESPSVTITARAKKGWLVITPKRGKGDRQFFEISIREDASLSPGRYDTQIELSAGRAPGQSLIIPVVVEVVGKI